MAAGRPRGRKKKNVEEKPIASPSAKQYRRSATSDLESPQEGPAVETPPLNEACVETQMPEPSTDITPSRPGRPRGRKKKNVEEQPIASPSVKQCRKSATSDLESPQEEPAVETPPLNEACVETQMPEPSTDITPSRPGRPRGRKKKNVEEQPIASPSVKQCRRSATSDLESPQEGPAVETPPLNEACVETQMPEPSTDVTPSRPGRPRGRKKKNVEEQPIASPSVKQCRKRVTSDLDSPQEEPAVETPPLNEACVETQMPEPSTDVTPSRPGRPRGRKKKNVEEQPIASPSVKQCRKRVTSDLDSPQEEPAVETPPLNEACVETQMPEPSTDVTPSRPGRPRGRKKKNVEEQPIASPSAKQCRRSATSDLESPQEEPAVETPPLNEACVETQMPEPSTDVTPSRPGRPRGRKKKNVEEQPIASPSVKQCRRSATSDLDSPQEGPAVETPPLNEACVETQMPEPSTDVTPSRPGRPRGRKKKNVEEQPIASPSVKQWRRSATSDLESPQEEPVETLPPNKAHVKTQMPEPQESGTWHFFVFTKIKII